MAHAQMRCHPETKLKVHPKKNTPYKAHIPIQLMQCICCWIILALLLGHVEGGKWSGDEGKTMPCTFATLS